MASIIEKLTQSQIDRMPEFVERWLKIGLCTDPADRPAAEDGVRLAYKMAGLKEPERIVWCGSPLSQGLTRAIVFGLTGNAEANVGDSVWASVRASVRASVWASVGAVRASVYGQHEAGWLAFHEYFCDVCGLPEQTQKLCGIWKVAQSANWWLPHEKTC
jgi:hypothetical protein